MSHDQAPPPSSNDSAHQGNHWPPAFLTARFLSIDAALSCSWDYRSFTMLCLFAKYFTSTCIFNFTNIIIHRDCVNLPTYLPLLSFFSVSIFHVGLFCFWSEVDQNFPQYGPSGEKFSPFLSEKGLF